MNETGFGKGMKILMYDGSIKNIEDILVGDKIMSVDSTPLKVLKLRKGSAQMYRITGVNDTTYTITENNTICIKYSEYKKLNYSQKTFVVSVFNINNNAKVTSKNFSWNSNNDYFEQLEKAKNYMNTVNASPFCDITLQRYFNYSKSQKLFIRGYRSEVDFLEKEILINPWLLGFWLGNSTQNEIFKISKISKVFNFCKDIKLIINSKKDNNFIYNLEIYDLLDGNKHIPGDYKINSREIRLEMLAGIVDSKGILYPESYKIRINKKNKKLAEDIFFLAKSLGFCSNILCDNKKGHYFVSIVGNILEIPLLTDKKAKFEKTFHDYTMYSILIKQIEETEYFGFDVEGGNKFLLDDFSVMYI